MTHIKKLNEKYKDEYLLVTHHESGDEIHFHILEISHLAHITDLIGSGHPGSVQSEELSSYIQQNEIDSLMCQTYALENYSFSKYNIIKTIYIPDLGY